MFKVIVALLLATSARAEITSFGVFPGGADGTVQFNDNAVLGGVPGSSVRGSTVNLPEVHADTAAFGASATRSTFNYTGALVLARNAALTLNGPNGSIVSGASITASAFFGDGSRLGNLPASGTVAELGVSTAALAARLDQVAVSTTAISARQDQAAISTTTLSASTVSLAGIQFTLGQSTGTLNASTISIAALQFTMGQSTAATQATVATIGVSTNATAVIVSALGVSTGALNFSTSSLSATKVDRAGDNMTGPLQISSTLTVTGNAFSVGDSSFVVIGSSVGIRVVAPTQALDIYGKIHASSGSFDGEVTATTFTAVDAAFIVDGTTIQAKSAVFGGNIIVLGTETVRGDNFSVGGSTFVVKNGRIGIGNTAPGAMMEIGAGTSAQPYLRFNMQQNSVQLEGQEGVELKAAASRDIVMGINPASGNFIVQDNNSVELLRVKGNGSIGVGTGTPTGLLEISSSPAPGSTDAARFISTRYSSDVIGAGLVIRKARGTGLSPAQTLAGDTLGTFGVRGYEDNVGFSTFSTGIAAFLADEDILPTNRGTRFGLFLTPTGSNMFAEVLRVTSVGKLGLGTTNPVTLLDIEGSAQFGSGANKSTFTAVGGLFINSGSSITLTGSAGYITSASSVTASAFFGDASHMTGIPPSGISSVTVNVAQFSGNGTNPANALTLLSSSVTLQGQQIIFDLNASTANIASIQFIMGQSTNTLSASTAAINASKVNRAGDTMTGALIMASGSSITLSGSGGFINSGSSINGSAFFGNGAGLSGVTTSPGNTVASSFTVTGAGGLLVYGDSVTASAFYGDGSHLSGLSSAEGNTFTSSKTFTSDVLAKSSVTANAFFGDGSHLTGVNSCSVLASPSAGNFLVGVDNDGALTTTPTVASACGLNLTSAGGGSFNVGVDNDGVLTTTPN